MSRVFVCVESLGLRNSGISMAASTSSYGDRALTLRPTPELENTRIVWKQGGTDAHTNTHTHIHMHENRKVIIGAAGRARLV